jgi:hypothetical protein
MTTLAVSPSEPVNLIGMGDPYSVTVYVSPGSRTIDESLELLELLEELLELLEELLELLEELLEYELEE